MPSAPRLILSAALILIAAAPAMATPKGAPAAQKGEDLFTRKGCIGCHTLKGHDGADGQLGPDLSKIGKERDKAFLVPWIQDPQTQKPGSAMPTLGLTLREAEALADYLLSERPRKGKRR
ncbi:Cytochrome c oxidase subunit 2 precursor [compost metagenome]